MAVWYSSRLAALGMEWGLVFRCSHKVDRGPVEPFGGGFPVKAQPGAHHQLVDPVSQMGKAQIADRPNLIRCGIQMKIICHGIFSSKIEIIVDI